MLFQQGGRCRLHAHGINNQDRVQDLGLANAAFAQSEEGWKSRIIMPWIEHGCTWHVGLFVIAERDMRVREGRTG